MRNRSGAWPMVQAKALSAALIGGPLLFFAEPAFACAEADGFKVAFSAGSIAQQWTRGELLCDLDTVVLGAGDYVVLRNAQRIWRFQGPGTFKVETTRSEPSSVLATLMRYLNASSWGLGTNQRMGATKNGNDKAEGAAQPVEDGTVVSTLEPVAVSESTARRRVMKSGA